MRVFAQVLLIGTLGGWVLAHPVTPAAQAPSRDPAPILAAAREALGGEKRLNAVKNFVATGRTRQVRGDNLVPIEFEIAVELPDKYVRKDEIPAQESGPTSTGFNGGELIQLPVPTAPAASPGAQGRAAGPAGPAPAPSQAQLDAARNARVATVKQDFVRLTLGMFAASFPSYPLTFSYIGQAEAPQGKADVLEAKAPPNFSVRLFINSQTHLPIMVSWEQAPGRGPGGRGGPGGAPARGGAAEGRGAPPRPEGAAPPGAAPPNTGRGTATPPPSTAPGTTPPQGPPAGAPAAGPPGAGAPPAGAPPAGAPSASAPGTPAGAPNPGRSAPPPAPVEYRIYYADYRDVDGMQWPFRLRRAVGADTTEETIFDRFKINGKIDPKKFEVRK